MKIPVMNMGSGTGVKHYGHDGVTKRLRQGHPAQERTFEMDSVSISRKGANKVHHSGVNKGGNITPPTGAGSGGTEHIMGGRSFLMRLAAYYRNHQHHLL